MKKIILFLLILFTPVLGIAKNESPIEEFIFDASGRIGLGEEPEILKKKRDAESPEDVNSIADDASEAMEYKSGMSTPKGEEVKEEVKKIKQKMQNDFNDYTKSIKSKRDEKAKPSIFDIPMEAHIVKFFMSALSGVAKALYKILKPFLNILIITLFAFWIMIEAWQMINGSKEEKLLEVAYRLVTRGFIITIWLLILNSNPVKIFSFIMMPIISIGTSVSEFILNAAADLIGANIPDTCEVIHRWLDNDTNMLLAGNYAADLICLPTRITAFFYTCIISGLEMIGVGLFISPLMLVSGLVMVVLFLSNLWKFLQIVLGVVMDLFFVLIFLPFTALHECFKGLEYKGFGYQIWKELSEFVKGTSLSQQIVKFINAIIYFIVLSVIASLVLAITSSMNPLADGNILKVIATGLLSVFAIGDIVTIIILGFLANYLLGQIDTIAKSFEINIDASFGTNFGEMLKIKAKGFVNKAKAIKDVLTGKSNGDGSPKEGTGSASGVS